MSTLVAQTISNGTVSTSSQNVIQGSAKAWVNFSLTGAVATVRSSYNVSSVTRTGAGYGAINFSTAFANTNYAIVCGGSETNSNSGSARFMSSCPSTTSQALYTFNSYIGSITFVDAPVCCISVFS